VLLSVFFLSHLVSLLHLLLVLPSSSFFLISSHSHSSSTCYCPLPQYLPFFFLLLCALTFNKQPISLQKEKNKAQMMSHSSSSYRLPCYACVIAGSTEEQSTTASALSCLPVSQVRKPFRTMCEKPHGSRWGYKCYIFIALLCSFQFVSISSHLATQFINSAVYAVHSSRPVLKLFYDASFVVALGV
jgi:hypothetical protein